MQVEIFEAFGFVFPLGSEDPAREVGYDFIRVRGEALGRDEGFDGLKSEGLCY